MGVGRLRTLGRTGLRLRRRLSSPALVGGAPPTVSVLLPVRDGADHLDEALESLTSQTFGDFEVVVVDDGSTDATPELLAGRADDDPRLRPLWQEAAGIVPALERGRAAARGRYLARMDADDVCAPDRLERQLTFLESAPELDGCGTLVEYVPRERVRAGSRRYERWINGLVRAEEIERDLFVECPLPHPTFFLRTGAVEAVGGYRDRGWPEDYDLVLRLWTAGARFGKVARVLLWWREGPDRLSRRHPSYSADAFRRCKVHFLRRTLLREREGVVIWGAGPTGKAFGRVLRRAGVALRAWVEVDPRKIGQEIHGAPVVDRDGATGFPGALHLGAVGQPGARSRIREEAGELGLVEMEDFVAVA